jgi:hypothetical protein
MHSFQTRLGPAGRTGRTVNRWVSRFEPTFGSAMQLTRSNPVKTGKNRWLGRVMGQTGFLLFFFFLLNWKSETTSFCSINLDSLELNVIDDNTCVGIILSLDLFGFLQLGQSLIWIYVGIGIILFWDLFGFLLPRCILSYDYVLNLSN